MVGFPVIFMLTGKLVESSMEDVTDTISIVLSIKVLSDAVGRTVGSSEVDVLAGTIFVVIDNTDAEDDTIITLELDGTCGLILGEGVVTDAKVVV